MTQPLKFHPDPLAPEREAEGETPAAYTGPNATRMPSWIRYALGDARGSQYGRTAAAVHERELVTICEEGRCPNRGECWSRGTATFMILGDTCTRACGFCSVKTGKPGTPPDYGEAEKVAGWIADVLDNPESEDVINRVKEQVLELNRQFPIYDF